MELGRVGCAVATSRSVPARVRVRVCVSALAFVCMFLDLNLPSPLHMTRSL
jgi:hypothetical protein